MVEWIGGKYLARMLSWSKGERGVASLNPIETKNFHQRNPPIHTQFNPKQTEKVEQLKTGTSDPRGGVMFCN